MSLYAFSSDGEDDLIDIFPRAGSVVKSKRTKTSQSKTSLDSSCSMPSLTRNPTMVQASRSIAAFVNNTAGEPLPSSSPAEDSIDPSCAPRQKASAINRKRLKRNNTSMMSSSRNNFNSSLRSITANRSEPIEDVLMESPRTANSSRRPSAAFASPTRESFSNFDDSIGVSSAAMAKYFKQHVLKPGREEGDSGKKQTDRDSVMSLISDQRSSVQVSHHDIEVMLGRLSKLEKANEALENRVSELESIIQENPHLTERALSYDSREQRDGAPGTREPSQAN
ncbi:hypothetical protein AGDE_15373 [Angomonas deanei]|nr:hypothetical protein AGDE_15373 [Angomonas deanei]|eukprot:EPY19192.1 hypothetical protein AGDE_15373 [Angomonas deanei]